MDLLGEYHHVIDAKRRLFIPAKLRAELGDVIYVTRKRESALIMYSSEGWQKLKDKLDALPDAQANCLKQYIFPKALDAVPDANGRIVLSKCLMDFAGLESDVVITGNLDHAEIWSEDKWREKEENMMASENLKHGFEEIGF